MSNPTTTTTKNQAAVDHRLNVAGFFIKYAKWQMKVAPHLPEGSRDVVLVRERIRGALKKARLLMDEAEAIKKNSSGAAGARDVAGEKEIGNRGTSDQRPRRGWRTWTAKARVAALRFAQRFRIRASN